MKSLHSLLLRVERFFYGILSLSSWIVLLYTINNVKLVAFACLLEKDLLLTATRGIQ
jgi:hypothetical protein